jgi:hypothetical protein
MTLQYEPHVLRSCASYRELICCGSTVQYPNKCITLTDDGGSLYIAAPVTRDRILVHSNFFSAQRAPKLNFEPCP